MLKKILLGFGLFIALAIAGFYVYAQSVIVEFSEEEERRIQQAILDPVPKQTGEEGFAMNGDTRIWYDVQNPEDSARGSLVLIMGLGADALAWPRPFIDQFLEAGYRVIRLDNRGVGMTDWDSFGPDNPYSLSDMAKDLLAVLDTLGIEKAHIAGVSMGGMIGQTFCIEHPERAASLISMMSTPWVRDPELPLLTVSSFLNIGINGKHFGEDGSEEGAIKTRLAVRTFLMGSEKYELDIERIAHLTLYNVRERNGYNPDAGRQQTTAIEISGSRIEQLKKLRVPTLVIHGKTDPLIPFEHGVKTAELVPNAETLWIDGLGHVIAPMYTDTIVESMVQHMQKANPVAS